jgi:hypothetical protein
VEVEIRLCGGGGDAFGRGRWAEYMESGQDGAHLFRSSRIISPAPFPSVTGFAIRTATYFLRPTLVSPVSYGFHLSVTDLYPSLYGF